jgi:hypothetical protein
MDTPKYAFILPNTWTKTQITWFRGATADLRPDQIERVWHLFNSWGGREGMWAWDFFRIMRRAVKNTLNNLP